MQMSFMHFIGWKPPFARIAQGNLIWLCMRALTGTHGLASSLRGIGEPEESTMHAGGGCRSEVER